MVPVFVLLCYQLEWTAYRALNNTLFVEVSVWLGIAVTNLSPTAFLADGQYFRFDIACTALDAYFGSIPLLWERQWHLGRTLRFLGVYFVCFSLLNLARLTIGFYWFAHGWSWELTHEVAAGVFYFALFCWIAHRRKWNLFSVGQVQPVPTASH